MTWASGALLTIMVKRVRIGVEACDLGLSRGRFGACTLDTSAGPPRRSPLSLRQRAARAIAGLGFLGLAAPLLERHVTRAIGAVPAWFGITHLVAAARAFDGCPELGAIPGLFLRRDVATQCGPWEWLDERLHLAPPEPARLR